MNTVRTFTIPGLFLSFLVMGAAQARGTIHVPEDHASIQAAIDAAANGDRVLIGPGIYNENLTVDVHGVRLIAREGLHSVIVDGTGLGNPDTGVDGIVVTADHVELRDLVVRNFAGYVGPGVVDFRVGVLVTGSHCRLTGNLAHSNGDGIVLMGATRCEVKDNVSRNNIHNGFFLRNGAWKNELKGNAGVDNGPNSNPAPDFVPAGVGCGIQLSFDANDNELKKNSVSGNGRGIQLDRGSTDNSVKNNVSSNNARFGIAALAVGGQPAAAGNEIKNNVSLANGEFDLIDQGFPPTVGNTWKRNDFDTSNF